MRGSFSTIARTVETHKEAIERMRKENEKLVARVQRLEFRNAQLANGSLSSAYFPPSHFAKVVVNETIAHSSYGWGSTDGDPNIYQSETVRVHNTTFLPLLSGTRVLCEYNGYFKHTDDRYYRNYNAYINLDVGAFLPVPGTVVSGPDGAGLYTIYTDVFGQIEAEAFGERWQWGGGSEWGVNPGRLVLVLYGAGLSSSRIFI
jgi:hypothetical protein